MSLFRFIVLALSTTMIARAQEVGNEWINFGQVYYKIPVAQDGLYKLTKSNLQNAGFPVNLDPRRYQLFYKGTEQAIIVAGQADSQFDDADYIEFYGKRNDGSLDGELYKPTSAQPHSFYNLYNDTSYYFLTYNPNIQGKRIGNFTQANVNNIAKETHHINEKLTVYTASYATGQILNNYSHYTSFDMGEGWSGQVLREGNTSDISITGLTNTVPAAGLPMLELQLLGRAAVNHRVEVRVGKNTGSLRLLATVNFINETPYLLSSGLLWDDIGQDGNMTIRVSPLGVDGAADFISVSYIKIAYPQNFSMNGATEKYLLLPENVSDKSYIEIQNAPASARVFDITDTNNIIQIGTTQSATLNAVVDKTTQARKLYVTNQSVSLTTIKRVTFTSYSATNANYVVLTHKALLKPAAGVANPVQEYVAYRSSPQGGGYNTLLVMVDQLYDQFSYGESTPIAIFRFLKFLKTKKLPDYLFIIGKGLTVNYNYYRNPNAYPINRDYVPTAGFPASDIYYSFGLGGTPDAPAISTGRLSATTPEHVVYYLNKVKEMEATPFDDLWRKQILHLSGGIREGEPQAFKSYMEDFQSTAENIYLGGKVTPIAKGSLKEQELINISEQVNEGVNLITFFGHSSATVADFDIGFVTNSTLGYSNKGRYPMLLVNGCNSGSYFNNFTTFGEDWVNASEKGALGFLAHSSIGFVSTLKRYTDTFYEVGYGDLNFIHKGIGDIQKETVRRYVAQSFPSPYNISQSQQMVLLGDPAVKLFGTTLPDFAIENTSVSVETTDGKPLTSSTSSFNLKLHVKNFGSAKEGQLSVLVKQTRSDNSSSLYTSTFPAVFFQDTLTFSIPNSVQSAGVNHYEIKIDSENDFEEINENNNSVTYTLFIPFSGTKNLFPPDFALINTLSPTLTFQSANLSDSLRYYSIEIDTINTFSSPYKKQIRVKTEPFLKIPHDLLNKDSVTYYWRTKFTYPSADENNNWEQTSFTYIIGGTEGWGQIHFPQFYRNNFENLIVNENVRSLSFSETKTPIYIKTFGDEHPALNTEVSVKISDAEYNLATFGQPCRDNTINFISLDKTTTSPYPAIPFNFQDPRTCGREPQVIVSFTPSEIYNNGNDDIIEYINNVEQGDSVILFTIGNPQLSSWAPQAIDKLKELGISPAQINVLIDGEPVVIYTKKGAIEGNAFVFTSGIEMPKEQELIVTRGVTGLKTTGNMRSVRVGPAKTWKSFIPKVNVQNQDIYSFNLFAINHEGQEIQVTENLTNEEDISFINAQEYPYLRLEYTTTDNMDLTPAQPQYCIVLYEHLPEGLTILKGTNTTKELSEGEEWSNKYAFVNISEKLFPDSLTVAYKFINKTTNSSENNTLKIKAPLPGDTTSFNISANTIYKAGENDVEVTVNPFIHPELYYDNNVLNLKNQFYVKTDSYNPAIAVQVDGRLLQNNDYVSPNPEIDIKIWDENKLILKTDTAGVRVLLSYPCDNDDCPFQPIYFKRQNIHWFKATNQSPFQVVFKPQNLIDGKYTLQVFAEDSRGNSSSEEPYTVHFQVKNETLITLSELFPNPTNGTFSMQFVIAGKSVPESGTLKFTDTIGKQIHLIELSSTDWHVGTNHISFDLQNSLIAGVYLYTISLRADQNVIKHGRLVVIKN